MKSHIKTTVWLHKEIQVGCHLYQPEHQTAGVILEWWISNSAIRYSNILNIGLLSLPVYL